MAPRVCTKGHTVADNIDNDCAVCLRDENSRLRGQMQRAVKRVKSCNTKHSDPFDPCGCGVRAAVRILLAALRTTEE